jgi:anhydro-N-acetylmuramic acid kinase
MGTLFSTILSGFTTQIGNGAIIAAQTGITVVSDFRSLDVALGGQGAPLVPIGDQLLFHEYDACLNLGGIANISFQKEGKRVAYDLSLCNIPLNYFAQKMGHTFDSDGKLAQQGNLIPELYKLLENLDFYTQQPPKSLGKEFFVTQVLPLVSQFAYSPQDILRTLTEHFATQIALNIPSDSKTLVTGGGAFNSFLMELIRSKSKAEIIIPDSKVVKFKEAVVFAFLGYLRLHHKNNTLSSVTGAAHDSCGGAVYVMN